jgi:flavin reductase (DIM6/NTAB) family NADH-FMN oxidoreductase RutF
MSSGAPAPINPPDVGGGEQQPSQLDPSLFREVLAAFPAGVVVVTALDDQTRPLGLTVSAFCSVSAEPPLVLVCVDRSSNTLPAIRHSQAFTVNILAAGREQLALLFASKSDDKFVAVAWEASQFANAGPILSQDAAAHLVCRVQQEIEAGDHWVFIGEVVDAAVQEAHGPLLYHRRTFLGVG